MTTVDARPVALPVLPDWLPAAMNRDLDEPLHGELVPLDARHVLPEDYVLCGSDSAGDHWLKVKLVLPGRAETVKGAVLAGDLVWRWLAADVLHDLALAEVAGFDAPGCDAG